MKRFNGLMALVAFLSFSTMATLSFANEEKKEEKKDGNVVVFSDDKKEEKKDKGGHVVFSDDQKSEKKDQGLVPRYARKTWCASLTNCPTSAKQSANRVLSSTMTPVSRRKSICNIPGFAPCDLVSAQ